MRRIAILGRGGAGKTTLACQLSEKLELPHIELDSLFWGETLEPAPPETWRRVQRRIIGQERWVIDGDLGPHDCALAERLAAADAIVILDFPLLLCVWRAFRRSRENLAFWRWVLRYRRASLPGILRLAALAEANGAKVFRLRCPADLSDFLAALR